MDKIVISDIMFLGHCGVSKEEQLVGQQLSVDVELNCNLTQAIYSDRLQDTVDYARLSREIQAIGKESVFQLIESLAEKIAKKLLEDQRIESVLVRVKKPHPPCEAIQGAVAIELHRRR